MNSNISKKFLSRMFRRVGGLKWDLTSGQLAIESNDALVTLTQTTSGEGDNAEVQFGTSVNPFSSFGYTIPAFATNTPLEQVEVGDIIVGDTKILGWVIEVRGASLKLLGADGMTKNYTPPKVAIMGTSGALVVKNLFSLVGGNGNLASLQGNLLPLLVLGGDSLDFDKIMPLILMQSMSGANGQAQANPMASMLPFLLLGKSGSGLGNIDPMMLMAMSGGFGGGAAMNPMMLMALSGGLGDDAEKVQSLPALTPAPAIPPLVRR